MAMTLLLGGAASGKSRTAAALAARTGLDVTVIATGEALDDEMAARIDRHRRERPDDWTVIEEPLDLVGAVERAGGATFADGADVVALMVAGRAVRLSTMLTDLEEP